MLPSIRYPNNEVLKYCRTTAPRPLTWTATGGQQTAKLKLTREREPRRKPDRQALEGVTHPSSTLPREYQATSNKRMLLRVALGKSLGRRSRSSWEPISHKTPIKCEMSDHRMRVRKCSCTDSSAIRIRATFPEGQSEWRRGAEGGVSQANKGIWWMPWQPGPKKDVVTLRKAPGSR